MASLSAGMVEPGNNGQTDQSRGMIKTFSYTKEARKTGKVMTPVMTAENSVSFDANKRTVNDPRLA